MAYNYKRLIRRISELYNSIEHFSSAMGIPCNSLQSKLASKSEFTAREIKLASKMLEISAEDISEYFFTLIV